MCLVDLKIKEIRRKYDEHREWEEMRERWKGRVVDDPPPAPPAYVSQYTSYDQMEEILGELELSYPDIAQRYSIGLSEEGRQIWCIKISRDIKSPRQILKPMVKFVANIHGDETVGRELLIGNSLYNFTPLLF